MNKDVKHIFLEEKRIVALSNDDCAIHTHAHKHTHANTSMHACTQKEEAESRADVKDLPQACRGHCSTFSSSTLSFTSTVSQHLLTFSVFLLFCDSITPHFLLPSPFLLTSNALSHHRSCTVQVFSPLSHQFFVCPEPPTTTYFHLSASCSFLTRFVLDF